MENIKSETPLDVALQSEFERGARNIIMGGGDLMHVTNYEIKQAQQRKLGCQLCIGKVRFQASLIFKENKTTVSPGV